MVFQVIIYVVCYLGNNFLGLGHLVIFWFLVLHRLMPSCVKPCWQIENSRYVLQGFSLLPKYIAFKMYYFINIIIEEASHCWEKVLLIILSLDSSVKVLLKSTKNFTTIISKRVGNVCIDLKWWCFCAVAVLEEVECSILYQTKLLLSLSTPACFTSVILEQFLFIWATLIFYLDLRHLYIAVTGGCEILWLDETGPVKTREEMWFLSI